SHLSTLPRPPTSTLLPYTTLFRSHRRRAAPGTCALGGALPAGLAPLRELHGLHLLSLVDHPSVGGRRVDDDHGRLSGLPVDPPVRRRSRGHGEMALRDRRPGLPGRHSRHRASLLLGGCPAVLAAHRWFLQRPREI